MKTTSTSFIMTKLLAIKDSIGRLTHRFYVLVKERTKYIEKIESFEIENEMYFNAPSGKKIRWILTLFFLIPIIIFVDYASLKMFIDFLRFNVSGNPFGTFLFDNFGIFIFFGLELFIAFAVAIINEKLEVKPNFFLSVLKYILMGFMIFIPAGLILAGYLMAGQLVPGLFTKTLVLMVLSIVLHTAFFIFMDDIIHAIGYIVFNIKKLFLSYSDPESKLDDVKASLRKEYSAYDIELLRFKSMPDSALYHSKVDLSKRDQFLKDKLEDDDDGNDYDEYIESKRHKLPTPTTSVFTPTTTVW